MVEWFRAYVLNLEFLCSNPLLCLSSGSVSRSVRIHSLQHSQCSNLRPFCAPLLVSSQGFQLKRLPAVYHHLQDFSPPCLFRLQVGSCDEFRPTPPFFTQSVAAYGRPNLQRKSPI